MPKAKEEDVAVPALPPTEEEKAAHAAFDVAMRNIVMDMDCACSARPVELQSTLSCSSALSLQPQTRE